MKSREELVNEPNEVSLLDFPEDVVRAIPKDSPDKEVKMKWALSRSCTIFHSFFQADLDKSGAERLLSYVLQGNAQEAKRMYTANPRLLFIEASANEYSAGIEKMAMLCIDE